MLGKDLEVEIHVLIRQVGAYKDGVDLSRGSIHIIPEPALGLGRLQMGHEAAQRLAGGRARDEAVARELHGGGEGVDRRHILKHIDILSPREWRCVKPREIARARDRVSAYATHAVLVVPVRYLLRLPHLYPLPVPGMMVAHPIVLTDGFMAFRYAPVPVIHPV